MCTKNGIIKKTTLEEYSRPRANGIIAINVREGDSLLEAKLTNGNNEIIIGVKSGKAIRFNENTVRPMGRSASGVRAVNLTEGDQAVGMVVADASNTAENILVLSENGYGKRSDLEDYRITNRGGKGVKTINVTEKTGQLIAIEKVTDEDDLMIINRSGITIRLKINTIPTSGRATQGVKLINLATRKGASDSIASIAVVPGSEDEEEIDENAENVENAENQTTKNNENDVNNSEQNTEDNN